MSEEGGKSDEEEDKQEEWTQIKKRKSVWINSIKRVSFIFSIDTEFSDHNVTLISLKHILKMKTYMYLHSTLPAFSEEHTHYL